LYDIVLIYFVSTCVSKSYVPQLFMALQNLHTSQLTLIQSLTLWWDRWLSQSLIICFCH